MKRFLAIASLSTALLLLADRPVFAQIAPGAGLPTSCDGLSAGAPCELGQAVGVCARIEPGEPADETGDSGAEDGGLACTSIPITEGCEGKPSSAACLLDGGNGLCGEEANGGMVCVLAVFNDEAGADRTTDQGGGSGCSVGSTETSLAFSLLGLLLPVVTRRRRRQQP